MRVFRSVIFWLHLVAGCVAGVVILTMSVSGVLLAFERQITTWVDTPTVFHSPYEPSQQPGIEPLLTTLEDSGRGTPTELVLRNKLNAPVEARYGRMRTLFLDPWTAEILGEPSANLRGFFGGVERIHRSLGLGMQNPTGRGITGAANIIFLFMLLSGMYLWLPSIFTAAGLKMRFLFRSGLQGRTREWNWHHVIGIWTAVPLFFIVVTGVIISYPWASNLLYTLTGSKPPVNVRPGDRGPREGAPNRGAHSEAVAAAVDFHGIDAALQTAKQQTAEWKSITITVPQPQDKTINLSVDKSIGGQPEKAFQLVMNRQSGQVESARFFGDNTTGRKLRSWARFLHTGEELGIFGQIVAALACLGAVLLVWTGMSMALRRALARFVLESNEQKAVEQEKETVAL
jgi:uncharacterized iron-regulated membrane protein